MSYSDYGLPQDFDPRAQYGNYTTSYGVYELSLGEIEDYYISLMKEIIIYGVRIGAASLAMLSLFLVSRSKKTPVFILNQICLLLVLIHSSLYLGHAFGNYTSVTYQFTLFPELLTTTDVNVYQTTNFFNILLMLFIETSLVFQVRTMFQDPSARKELGGVITAAAVATGIATIGLCLYNFAQLVMVLNTDITGTYNSPALKAQPILFASSINFMSLLLICKLVMAIRSRRYLGLKQFDGFHVLLIMTTQSMVLPSVILILSYAVDAWSSVALPSLSTLLVALSLPLSSMWAASANNAPNPTSSGSHTYTPASATFRGSSFYSSDQTVRGDTSFKIEADHSEIYTPSTAAEEDAKRYWFGQGDNDDNADVESEFVSKTTHQISSGNSV